MSVVLKVGGDFFIDMSSFYYAVGRAYIDSVSSKKISGFLFGQTLTISGTGFSTDSDGELSAAGTIRSVELLSYAGETWLSISGLKLSVNKVAEIPKSGAEKQALSLLSSMFKSNDTLNGGEYADFLSGYDGNDHLNGNGGGDLLKGGGGNDKLYGGAKRDFLYGEAGKDTFIFKRVSDSTASSSGRDTIEDFNKKQGDMIDLSAIDANSKSSGNQAFKFIGDDDFNGKAGELRFTKVKSDTYIQADVNGDRKADFGIHLDYSLSMSKGDFLL